MKKILTGIFAVIVVTAVIDYFEGEKTGEFGED